MKSIEEIKNFEGKRVMIRVDWNVPLDKLGVNLLDTERVDRSLDTIRYVLNNGGKVMVVSHLGREGDTLQPVFDYFSKIIESEFAPDIDNVPNSQVVVLENIRKYKEEEENDDEFAKKLAGLADMYVNEAFSNSHREHASIVGVPKYLDSFAGLEFVKEVGALSEAFNPPHPFLLILGGAKFETKLPLIEKFLNIADDIFIGGAMKAHADMAPESDKIMWPVDKVGALDAGEETLKNLELKIKNSRFILWNGPVGKYEDGYVEGTQAIARMLAESSAQTVVGGGDTLSAIKSLGLYSKFAHVSSAGGAMLDFLAYGTLPGIKALQ